VILEAAIAADAVDESPPEPLRPRRREPLRAGRS